jgi:hypothetical protein
MYFHRLKCRPLPCMLLNMRFSVDSIPSALTIFSITWRSRTTLFPPIVSILCPLLHALTGNVRNFVDLLVLILHGGCYRGVAHRLHHRK